MKMRWLGSCALSTSLLVVTGCYSQPDVDDGDTTEASGATGTEGDTQTSASSNPGTATSNGPTSADSGDATTSPVADSGDSTTDGPMTSGTTTGEDAGTDSTGAGSTGGGLDACANDPVSADLPGPAMAACGSSWVIGDITFQIQNSEHPTCGTGGCSAGIAQGQGGMWVYPAQLYADLTGIMCEPAVVDVTLTDYASGAYVTLYDETGAIVASDYSNLSGGNQETVSLAVPLGTTLAGVGAHGCETLVHRIEVR